MEIKHIGEFELGQSMLDTGEHDSLVFDCHCNRLKCQSCLGYSISDFSYFQRMCEYKRTIDTCSNMDDSVC